MRNIGTMHRFILILLQLVVSLMLSAQIKRVVNVTTNIIPPYSPFINDYYESGGNKLISTLIFNDFNEPSWEVKLHLKIESNAVTFETSTSFFPRNPIVLTPGVPLQIKGEDWAEYFDFDNMSISGIDPAVIRQNGIFPEGQYIFTVDVLDYRSGQPLSNKSIVMATIRLGGVPEMIEPKSTVLMPKDPQFINFQWQLATPPANPLATEYQFRIYDITSDDVAPEAALVNGNVQLLYESGFSPNQFLLYDASLPTLQLQKKYAYTIQVRDAEGKSLYKNDGMSKQYWFAYGFPVGGLVKLEQPVDKKSFLKDQQRYFKWSVPNNRVNSSQKVAYRLKIVQISDTLKAKDEIETKPAFYEETSQETSSPNGWETVLNDEPLPGKWYAWQITATSGSQEIAKSNVWKFKGPPLIEKFKAAGQDITVVRTDNDDLKNLSGVASFKYGLEESDTVEVPFKHLKIAKVGDVFALEDGEIVVENFKGKPIELKPKTEGGVAASFQPTGLKVNKVRILLKGNLKTPVSFTVDGDDAGMFASQETWLTFNDFKLNGILKFEKGKNDFNLLEPKNFKLMFSDDSYYVVSDNTYSLIFSGKIALPESVLDQNGKRIELPFKELSSLDYIVTNEVDDEFVYPKYKPHSNINMWVRPTSFIFDNSDSNSPENISDKMWRGMYFPTYELIYEKDIDLLKQLTLQKEAKYQIKQGFGANDVNFFTAGGLQFYRVEKFDEAIVKFNQFQSKIKKFELSIVNSAVKEGSLAGSIVIPFIDAIRPFSYTVPVNEDGFASGFLDEKLDNQTVIFNPEGGERAVKLTIKRAVFADNERLDMVVDVDYPAFSMKFNNIDDVRLYGDYNVGISKQNGSVPLASQVNGVYQGFKVVADTVGLTFLRGNYVFLFGANILLGEEVKGQNGPPRLNIFSANQIGADFKEVADASMFSAFKPTVEVPVKELIEPGAPNQPEKPKRIEIENVRVEIDCGIAKMAGELTMERNVPEWGTVMRGSISGNVFMPAKIDIGSNIILGDLDGLKYWYFDLFFVDTKGGGVDLQFCRMTAIEGRAYRHMRTLGEAEEGTKKPKVKVDRNIDFGLAVYTQLIDPDKTSPGKLFKIDLGAEIIFEKGDFTMTFLGEGAFMNSKGRDMNAAQAAIEAQALDKVKDLGGKLLAELNNLRFSIGNVTVSPYLKDDLSEAGLTMDINSGEYITRLFGDPIALQVGASFAGKGHQAKVQGMTTGGLAEYYYNGNGFKAGYSTTGKYTLGMAASGFALEGALEKLTNTANLSFGNSDFKTKISVQSKKGGLIDVNAGSTRFYLNADIPKKMAGMEFSYGSTKAAFDFSAGTGSPKGSFTYQDPSLKLGAGANMSGNEFAGNLEFSYGSNAMKVEGSKKGGQIMFANSSFTFDVGAKSIEKKGWIKFKEGQNLFGIDIDMQSKTGGINLEFGQRKFGLGVMAQAGSGYFMLQDGPNKKFNIEANKNTKSGKIDIKIDQTAFNIELDPNKAGLGFQINDVKLSAFADKSGKGSFETLMGSDKLSFGGDKTGYGYFDLSSGSTTFGLNFNKNSGSGLVRFRAGVDSVLLSVDKSKGEGLLATSFSGNSFGASFSSAGSGSVLWETAGRKVELKGNKVGYGALYYKENGKLIDIMADKPNNRGHIRLYFDNDSLVARVDKTKGSGSLYSVFGKNAMGASYDNAGLASLLMEIEGRRFELSGSKAGNGKILFSDNSTLFAITKEAQSGSARLRFGSDSVSSSYDFATSSAAFNASIGGLTLAGSLINKTRGSLLMATGNNRFEMEGGSVGRNRLLVAIDRNRFDISADRTSGSGYLSIGLGQDSLRTSIDNTAGVAQFDASFGGNAFAAALDKKGTGSLLLNTGDQKISISGGSVGPQSLLFVQNNNLFNINADKQAGTGLFRLKLSNDSIRLAANTVEGTAQLISAFGGNTLGASLDKTSTGSLKLYTSAVQLDVSGNSSGYGSLSMISGSNSFRINADKSVGKGDLAIRLGSDSIGAILDKSTASASLNMAFGGNSFSAALLPDRTGKLLFSDPSSTISLMGNPSGNGSLLVKTSSALINIAGDKAIGGHFIVQTGNDSLVARLNRSTGSAYLATSVSGNMLQALLDQSGKGTLSLSGDGKKISLGGDKTQGIGYLSLSDGSSAINVYANKQNGGRFSINSGSNDSISAVYDKTNNLYSLSTAYSGNNIGARYDKTGSYLNLKSGEIDIALGGSKATGVSLKALKGTQGVKLFANKQNQGAITIYTGSDSIKAATNKAWQVAGAAVGAAAVGGLTYLTFGDDIKAGIDDDGKLNLYMKKGDNKLSLSGYQSGKGNLGMAFGDKAIYAMANPQDKAGSLRLKSGSDSMRVAYDSKVGKGDMAFLSAGTAFSADYDKSGKGMVSLESDGKSIKLMADKTGIGSLLLKDPNNIFDLYANQPAGVGYLKLGFGSDSMRTSIDKAKGTALMNAYIQGNLFAANFNQNGTGTLQLNTKEQEILLSGGSVGAQTLRFKQGDKLFNVEADKQAGTGLFGLKLGSDSINVQGNTTEGTAILNSAFAGVQLGAGLDKTGTGSLRLYVSDSKLDVSGGNGIGALRLQKGSDLFNIAAKRSAGTGNVSIKLGNDSISGAIDKTQGTAMFNTAFGGNQFAASINSDRSGRLLFSNTQNIIELNGNPQGNGGLLVKTGNQQINITGDKVKGGSFRYTTGSDSIRAILDRQKGTAELSAGSSGNSLLALLDQTGKGTLSLSGDGKKISLGGDKTQGIVYLSLSDGSSAINVNANKQSGGRFSINNGGNDSISAVYDKSNSIYSLSTAYSGNNIGARYDKTGSYLNLKSGEIDIALGGSKATGVSLKALKGTQGVKLFANKQNQGAITIYTGSDSIKAATNKAWQVAGAAVGAAAVGGLTYLTFGDDIKAGIDDDGKLNLNMKKGDNKLSLSGYQSGKGNLGMEFGDKAIYAMANPQDKAGSLRLKAGSDSMRVAYDTKTGKGDIAFASSGTALSANYDKVGKGMVSLESDGKSIKLMADKTGIGSLLLKDPNNIFDLYANQPQGTGYLKLGFGSDSMRTSIDKAKGTALMNAYIQGNLFAANFNQNGTGTLQLNTQEQEILLSGGSIGVQTLRFKQGDNQFNVSADKQAGTGLFGLKLGSDSLKVGANLTTGNANLETYFGGSAIESQLGSDGSGKLSILASGNKINLSRQSDGTNFIAFSSSDKRFSINGNRTTGVGNLSLALGNDSLNASVKNSIYQLNAFTNGYIGSLDIDKNTSMGKLRVSKDDKQIALSSVKGAVSLFAAQGKQGVKVSHLKADKKFDVTLYNEIGKDSTMASADYKTAAMSLVAGGAYLGLKALGVEMDANQNGSIHLQKDNLDILLKQGAKGLYEMNLSYDNNALHTAFNKETKYGRLSLKQGNDSIRAIADRSKGEYSLAAVYGVNSMGIDRNSEKTSLQLADNSRQIKLFTVSTGLNGFAYNEGESSIYAEADKATGSGKLRLGKGSDSIVTFLDRAKGEVSVTTYMDGAQFGLSGTSSGTGRLFLAKDNDKIQLYGEKSGLASLNYTNANQRFGIRANKNTSEMALSLALSQTDSVTGSFNASSKSGKLYRFNGNEEYGLEIIPSDNYAALIYKNAIRSVRVARERGGVEMVSISEGERLFDISGNRSNGSGQFRFHLSNSDSVLARIDVAKSENLLTARLGGNEYDMNYIGTKGSLRMMIEGVETILSGSKAGDALLSLSSGSNRYLFSANKSTGSGTASFIMGNDSLVAAIDRALGSASVRSAFGGNTMKVGIENNGTGNMLLGLDGRIVELFKRTDDGSLLFADGTNKFYITGTNNGESGRIRMNLGADSLNAFADKQAGTAGLGGYFGDASYGADYKSGAGNVWLRTPSKYIALGAATEGIGFISYNENSNAFRIEGNKTNGNGLLNLRVGNDSILAQLDKTNNNYLVRQYLGSYYSSLEYNNDRAAATLSGDDKQISILRNNAGLSSLTMAFGTTQLGISTNTSTGSKALRLKLGSDSINASIVAGASTRNIAMALNGKSFSLVTSDNRNELLVNLNPQKLSFYQETGGKYGIDYTSDNVRVNSLLNTSVPSASVVLSTGNDKFRSSLDKTGLKLGLQTGSDSVSISANTNGTGAVQYASGTRVIEANTESPLPFIRLLNNGDSLSVKLDPTKYAGTVRLYTPKTGSTVVNGSRESSNSAMDLAIDKAKLHAELANEGMLKWTVDNFEMQVSKIASAPSFTMRKIRDNSYRMYVEGANIVYINGQGKYTIAPKASGKYVINKENTGTTSKEDIAATLKGSSWYRKIEIRQGVTMEVDLTNKVRTVWITDGGVETFRAVYNDNTSTLTEFGITASRYFKIDSYEGGYRLTDQGKTFGLGINGKKELFWMLGDYYFSVSSTNLVAKLAEHKFEMPNYEGLSYNNGKDVTISSSSQALNVKTGQLEVGISSSNKNLSVILPGNNRLTASDKRIDLQSGDVKFGFGFDTGLALDILGQTFSATDKGIAFASGNNKITLATDQLTVEGDGNKLALSTQRFYAKWNNIEGGFDENGLLVYKDGTRDLSFDSKAGNIRLTDGARELSFNKQNGEITAKADVDKHLKVSATSIDAQWGSVKAGYGKDRPVTFTDGTRSFSVSGEEASLSDGNTEISYKPGPVLSFKQGTDASLNVTATGADAKYKNLVASLGNNKGLNFTDGTRSFDLSTSRIAYKEGDKEAWFDVSDKTAGFTSGTARNVNLGAARSDIVWDGMKLSFGSGLPLAYSDDKRSFALDFENKGLELTEGARQLSVSPAGLLLKDGDNKQLTLQTTGASAKWDNVTARFSKEQPVYFTDGNYTFDWSKGEVSVGDADNQLVLSEVNGLKLTSKENSVQISQTAATLNWSGTTASYDKVSGLKAQNGDRTFELSGDNLSLKAGEALVSFDVAQNNYLVQQDPSKTIEINAQSLIAKWDNINFGFGKDKGLSYTDGIRSFSFEGQKLELVSEARRVSYDNVSQSLEMVDGTERRLAVSPSVFDMKWDNMKLGYADESGLSYADGTRSFALSGKGMELTDGDKTAKCDVEKKYLKLQTSADRYLELQPKLFTAKWDNVNLAYDDAKGFNYNDGTNSLPINSDSAELSLGDVKLAYNIPAQKLRFVQGAGRAITASANGLDLAWDDILTGFAIGKAVYYKDQSRSFDLSGDKLAIEEGANKVSLDAAAKSISLVSGDSRKIAANAQGIDIAWDNIKTTFDKTKGASFSNGTQSFNLGNDKFALTSGTYSIGVDAKAQTLEFADGIAKKVTASATALDIAWDNIKAGYAEGKSITYTDGTRSFDLSKGLTLKDGDNMVAVTEKDELIINAGANRRLYASAQRIDARYDDYQARYTADSAVYIAAADNKLSIGGGKLNLNMGDNSLAVGKDTTIQLKLGEGKELNVSPKALTASWDDYKFNLGGKSLLYFTDGQRIVDLSKSDLELVDGDRRVSVGADASLQIVNGTTGYLSASQKGLSSKWDNYRFVVNNDSLLYFTDGTRLVDLSKQDLELRDGNRMVAIGANGNIKLQDGETHTLSASKTALRASWDDYRTTISSDTALYFTNGSLKIDLSKQEQSIQDGDKLVAFNLNDTTLRIAMGSGKELKASPTGANLAWDNIKAAFGASRNLSFTDGERSFAFEGQKLELASGTNRVGFDASTKSISLVSGDSRKIAANAQGIDIAWDNIKTTFDKTKGASFSNGTQSFNLGNDKFALTSGTYSIGVDAKAQTLEFADGIAKKVTASATALDIAWDNIKAGYAEGKSITYTDGTRSFDLSKGLTLKDGDNMVAVTEKDELIINAGANRRLYASAQRIDARYDDYQARYTADSAVYIAAADNKLSIGGGKLNLNMGDNSLVVGKDTTIQLKLGEGKELNVSPKALTASWDDYKFNLGGQSLMYFTDGQRTVDLSKSDLELVDGDRRVSVGSDASLQIINGTKGYLRASQKGLSSKWDNYKFVVNNDSLLYFTDGQRVVDLSKQNLELSDGDKMVGITADKGLILKDGANRTLYANSKGIRTQYDKYRLSITPDTAMYFTNGDLTIDLSKQEQSIQSGDKLAAFNMKDTTLRLEYGSGKQLKASPSGADLAWDNIKAAFGASRTLSFTDGTRSFVFAGQKLELADGDQKVSFDAAQKSIGLVAGSSKSISANAQGVDITWDNIKTTFDKTKGASFSNGTQSFNLGDEKFALSSGSYSVGVNAKAQTLEFSNGEKKSIAANADGLKVAWDEVKASFAAGKNLEFSDGTRSFQIDGKQLSLQDGDRKISYNSERNNLNLVYADNSLTVSPDTFAMGYGSMKVTASKAKGVSFIDGSRTLSINSSTLELSDGERKVSCNTEKRLLIVQISSNQKLTASPEMMEAMWNNLVASYSPDKAVMFSDGTRTFDLSGNVLSLADGDRKVSYNNQTNEVQLVMGKDNFKASPTGAEVLYSGYGMGFSKEKGYWLNEGARKFASNGGKIEFEIVPGHTIGYVSDQNYVSYKSADFSIGLGSERLDMAVLDYSIAVGGENFIEYRDKDRAFVYGNNLEIKYNDLRMAIENLADAENRRYLITKGSQGGYYSDKEGFTMKDGDKSVTVGGSVYFDARLGNLRLAASEEKGLEIQDGSSVRVELMSKAYISNVKVYDYTVFVTQKLDYGMAFKDNYVLANTQEASFRMALLGYMMKLNASDTLVYGEYDKNLLCFVADKQNPVNAKINMVVGPLSASFKSNESMQHFETKYGDHLVKIHAGKVDYYASYINGSKAHTIYKSAMAFGYMEKEYQEGSGPPPAEMPKAKYAMDGPMYIGKVTKDADGIVKAIINGTFSSKTNTFLLYGEANASGPVCAHAVFAARLHDERDWFVMLGDRPKDKWVWVKPGCIDAFKADGYFYLDPTRIEMGASKSWSAEFTASAGGASLTAGVAAGISGILILQWDPEFMATAEIEAYVKGWIKGCLDPFGCATIAEAGLSGRLKITVKSSGMNLNGNVTGYIRIAKIISADASFGVNITV